jgi:hypothetical protein
MYHVFLLSSLIKVKWLGARSNNFEFVVLELLLLATLIRINSTLWSIA